MCGAVEAMELAKGPDRKNVLFSDSRRAGRAVVDDLAQGVIAECPLLLDFPGLLPSRFQSSKEA